MHRIPRLILRFLSLLPLRALHALGTVLGWIMYGTSPTYRRRLRAHLAQAGYGADAAVARSAIAAAGQMIMETPALWFRPHAEVAALVKEEASGFAPALAARAAGKALLFLTPHLGSFEAAAQYVGKLMPLTGLYRPPKMRWLEPAMLEGRGREGMRVEPANYSGVRRLFEALKRGEAVGLLPDHVPGTGEGEWAEFFGRPAYTMTLAARLAGRADVACFLVRARRRPRGRGYSIAVRPLPEPLPGETQTRRINRAIEMLVRECPGQYLWSYNRYKQPAGAPRAEERAA